MTEEIPKSEETPEELCPDCGVRMAFAVKCFVAPDSWLCQTCFNVRWQRDHGRQSFWERVVEASIVAPVSPSFNGCVTAAQITRFADAMTKDWDARFGTK